MRTAAYARYSSEAQREASIEDQARNCREYCARQGWPAPVLYHDAAVTGSRKDRPGYQRLLAEASRYDVILVDDLYRLSRDSIEAQQQVRRLRFAGVRVISLSDGIDTDHKSHKLNVGLRGLMGEIYLDDLRDKTHRGLTGRALEGASAGGLPYGYRVTGPGHREIDAIQADVVRRIFAEFNAGASPRQIAADLNAEGIPSPRGTSWTKTAIRSDAKRNIGILVNPIYIGRQVWNRSRWVKHPDTGRRLRQERPESEWIVSQHPELAIVSPEQWDAAQARQRRRAKASGGAGRPARHLLSGILRCGACGGPLVVVDRYSYGCANQKNKGTCAGVRPKIRDAEDVILASVRDDLLSEARFQAFIRAVNARLAEPAPNRAALQRRLAESCRERDNIMQAIRAGILTPSTKAALENAEAAVQAAEAAIDAASAPAAARILPRARERWQGLVRGIADRTRGNGHARDAIRALLGNVVVRNENGDLVAEIAGSSSTPEHAQICVVAGAGYVPYLTDPVRIVLTRASRA